MNESLKWALKYYDEYGLVPIPVVAKSKHPPKGFNLQKWWYERPSREQVVEWFSNEPMNIGIVTGRVSGNLLGIDIDDNVGGSERLLRDIKNLDVLRKTTVAITPRGLHILVRLPPEISGYFNVEYPLIGNRKIEFYFGRKYIIMPPGVHESGKPYEFLSDAPPYIDNSNLTFLQKLIRAIEPASVHDIITKLKKAIEQAPRSDPIFDNQARVTRSTTVEPKIALKLDPTIFPPCLKHVYLNGVDKGSRNNSAFVLGAFLHTFLGYDFEEVYKYLEEWNERNRPPLPLSEIRSVARSVRREYRLSCRAFQNKLEFPKQLCETCPVKKLYSHIDALGDGETPKPIPPKIEPIPDDIIPVKPVLAFRPGQAEAIRKIIGSRGNILLRAPTGWGKTLVYLTAIAGEPTLVVTPYKALQDQLKEYGVFAVYGRSAYKCPIIGESTDKAPCVVKKNYKCELKEECPYYQAKDTASSLLKEGGTVAVNPGNMWQFIGLARNVVLDEAHRVIEMLSNPIRLRWTSPEDLSRKSFKDILLTELVKVNSEIEALRELADDLPINSEQYKKLSEQFVILDAYRRRISVFLSFSDSVIIYEKSETGRVYARLLEKGTAQRVKHSLKGKDRVIWVSATPPDISFDVQISIESDHLTEVNAPIYYLPIDNFSVTSLRRSGQGPQKLRKEAIIINYLYNHYRSLGLTEKLVVHSGNTGTHGSILSDFLKEFGWKVLRHEKGSLKETIEEFKRGDYDVLVIASADVGFDFAGVEYGLQIIAKVPYPERGEEFYAIVRHRGEDEAERWYNKKTVDTIVQITGRVARGYDDIGVTFILDQSFEKLVKNWAHLFPRDFWNRFVDLSGRLKVEELVGVKS